MLLAIFFIIGTAIFRGSLNYIIINAILSIGSISGIYMSNSLLLIMITNLILRNNLINIHGRITKLFQHIAHVKLIKVYRLKLY